MKTGAKNPPRKFDAVHGFQHGFQHGFYFFAPPKFLGDDKHTHLKPYTDYGTEAKTNKKKKKKKEKCHVLFLVPSDLRSYLRGFKFDISARDVLISIPYCLL